MTIYTSNLLNDQDMIKALGSMAVPIPIAFGDAVFWGVSGTDEPIRVCVERKKIGDMASCILDGRYLHQAQSAKEAGMDVLCLVVEGVVRPSPDDGLLEVPVWGINPRTMHRTQLWSAVRPSITYHRFCGYLVSLQYLAGVLVFRSGDVKETASVIKCLWSWFQKPPSDHQSLKMIYRSLPPQVQLLAPSLVRRMATELKGVGWERSQAVAEHFGTVRAMVVASVKEWESIPGIGRTIAKRIVQSLGGTEYGE